MPLTRHYLAEQWTAQVFDDVVGKLPAFVKSLVDDRRILPDLREVVAIETRVSALAGVGNVNISDTTSCGLIDASPVVLNPREMPEIFFAIHRDNRNIARILAIRIGANFEYNLLAR